MGLGYNSPGRETPRKSHCETARQQLLDKQLRPRKVPQEGQETEYN
jgi:hypothetical protein